MAQSVDVRASSEPGDANLLEHRTPTPVLAVSACVAASLLGDGVLYVVLPVVFASRGLAPMEVGIILSANRWIRLLTNAPAARMLSVLPVRSVFGGALLLGGLTSIAYGVTSSFYLLLLARLVWGGCWSVIRLTGLVTVTDCIDAALAPERMVGRMTGMYSGLSRLGSG